MEGEEFIFWNSEKRKLYIGMVGMNKFIAIAFIKLFIEWCNWQSQLHNQLQLCWVSTISYKFIILFCSTKQFYSVTNVTYSNISPSNPSGFVMLDSSYWSTFPLGKKIQFHIIYLCMQHWIVRYSYSAQVVTK